jgi:hypothetical protein
MPDEAETLAEAIERAAKEPKSASGDTGSMTSHSLSEMIEADKYVKSQSAMQPRRKFGLRQFKHIPPGTV